MNNKSVPQSVLDQNNVTKDFVETLASKLTDAAHLNCALRMFIQGSLPMDHILNAESIDLPAIRKQIADHIRNRKQEMAKRIEETRRLAEFYSTCKIFKSTPRKMSTGKKESYFVFIKDGRFMAFGVQSDTSEGIFAANNTAHGKFNWNPNKHLAFLRNLDKAFYKSIKKAAFAEDRSVFDMSQRTIRTKS